MNEGYISTGRVVAIALWAWVAGLMIAAWLVLLLNHGDAEIAGMLAATACASSAGAAVLHIKTYMVRVCTLLRTTRDVGTAPPVPQQQNGSLHRIT